MAGVAQCGARLRHLPCNAWCRGFQRRYDLRFADAAKEKAFTKHFDAWRRRHVLVVASATTTVIAITQGTFFRAELGAEIDPLVWGERDYRWVWLASVLSSASLFMFLTFLGVLLRRFRNISMEVFVITFYLAVFTMLTWLNFWSHSYADPESPAYQRAAPDHANTILSVQAGVTILSLGGVLRVHRLWFPILFSVASFAGSVYFFPNGRRAGLINTVAIVMLLDLFALHGAWRNERFVRTEWEQRQKIQEQEMNLSVQQALADGMRAVAEQLCDFVIGLGADLNVCSQTLAADSFFGRSVLGKGFADAVAEQDQERFRAALQYASELQIPQCSPIALIDDRQRHRAGQVLITDTGSERPKYIIGVSLETDRQEPTGSDVHLAFVVPHAQVDDARSLLGSDLGTTFTGEIFARGVSDNEGLARLGQEEHWWVDASEVRVPSPLCILGRGGFGAVAAASFHGRAVAVKTLHHGADDRRQNAALLNELRVLRHIRHPSVVLFFGAILEKGSIALVYELIRGVQLDKLVKRTALPRKSRFQMLFDISSALRYLHAQRPPIAHGDLKGGNVMVEDDGVGHRAKLIDFGLSRFVSRRVAGNGGTTGWMAPECFLREAGGTVGADVFAFGWLARLVLAAQSPYSGRCGEALVQAVREMLRERSVPQAPLPEGTPWREQCVALSRACLEFDVRARPTMAVVQDTLQGWLDASSMGEMDFRTAIATCGGVPWSGDACEQLASAATGGPSGEFAQIDMDLTDDFRVTYRATQDGSGRVLPAVGDCFLAWVGDAPGFRLTLLALWNDLRSAPHLAPLKQLLCGLDFHEPRLFQVPEARKKVCATLLFPDGSGKVSVRLPLEMMRHSVVAL